MWVDYRGTHSIIYNDEKIRKIDRVDRHLEVLYLGNEVTQFAYVFSRKIFHFIPRRADGGHFVLDGRRHRRADLMQDTSSFGQ